MKIEEDYNIKTYCRAVDIKTVWNEIRLNRPTNGTE